MESPANSGLKEEHMTTQITRRGVAVTPKNRFELYAWLFMRISGIILVIMAVFHLLYMHFVIQVDNINYDVIATRWANMGWRIFDFTLLALAFTHGMNGARVVLQEYTPLRLHKWIMGILLIIYLLLVLMGAWIIFTFSG
jgi:succinate dehydrogenase / fumarate reductase, membrane anchor subunit